MALAGILAGMAELLPVFPLGTVLFPGLSYLVAAAMVLEIGERQALLAEPDAAARLRAERALLGREIAMLRSLPSAPAAGLRYRPYSPN